MRRTTVEQPESKSLSFANVYLLIYNVIQAAGWSYIALRSILYLLTGTHGSLYSKVDLELKIFQSLAVLEILHAFFGLVKSSPIVTALQVYSRVFLVWGVINISDEAKVQIGFSMLLFAWTVTEITRYAFYAGNIMGRAPYLVVYARYTFFIILYPIGVTGELLSLYSSLSAVKKESIFTYSLPNTLNMSFDYYSFLVVMALAYVPCFPKLYMYMFAQRKKALVKRD